jgi:hypothetical protein
MRDHVNDPQEVLMSDVKITRRGFASRKYPVPASVIEAANAQLERTITDEPILAELRPAVYCGPGSAGDRGSYMLSISTGGAFWLHEIERGV